MEIDCRREEARHPGSLCTPLPSRPLCFLNSPPDILGPRSAGPKTSSSGEQTPEGVLGSLFLLATARSYSGPGVVGRIRTRGRGRVQPYPRLCAAHVPSRSDESDRAHEPLLDRSKPFYDISVSKRCALLGPFSCALRACSDARDHNTTIFSSPKGEGFRPSPEETLSRSRGGGTCKLSRTGEPNWGHFACAFFAAAHRPSRESRRAGRVKGFARFARRLRRPGHDLRAVMRVTMGDGRTGASGRGSGLRVLHGKPAAVNSLASNPFPLFFRATGARRD